MASAPPPPPSPPFAPAPPHADDDALAVAAVTIKPNLRLMSNSERGKYYRRKRRLFAAELEARVARLRRHVRHLEASRQLQCELALGLQRTPIGALARLTREYYAQFEFGTPVTLLPAATPGAPPVRVAAASPTQVNFLCAAMDECVGFGNFTGIALLLNQWQRYSEYHSELRFELKSLDVRVPETQADDDDNDSEPPQPVIAARADLHVRITRETIEQVFPHLLTEGNPLVDELMGLAIVYPCVNLFYFTSEGKITRYDPYVDYFSGFMNKIRTLAGVTQMLERARLANHHMIGVIGDVVNCERGADSCEAADAETSAAPPAQADSDSDVASVSSPSSVEVQSDALEPTPHGDDRLSLDFILS